MARKVFQNDDLLRYIYGYGDNHRDHMRRICCELKPHILSKVPFLYPYTPTNTFVMNDMNMQETLMEFFFLRRCMCCTRHCHNKPNLWLETRFSSTWIAIDNSIIHVLECKNLRDCDCDCRHKMRVLSRRIKYRSALNTVMYG
jgi:hypothetical protein